MIEFRREPGCYIIEDKPLGYRKEIDMAEALKLAEQITRWAHVREVCREAEQHIESLTTR